MYALLRAIAGIALRWFYRDIQVAGADSIPRRTPILLVVNHPNALVDALLIGWVVPRRVLITAKATLFENRIAATLLSWVGVLPLRRASDELRGANRRDPTRNVETFRAVNDALRRGQAVLIFPEGRTHDEPSLAPLKTGAARMALYAKNDGGVAGLSIVPIGLTFEQKDAPRSRVLVHIGEAIALDRWQPPPGEPATDALIREIERRLRAVTLNYSTADDAARMAALTALVASLFADSASASSADRSLGTDAAIARRIAHLATRLPAVEPAVRARADDLVRRLHSLYVEVSARGISIEDVDIPLRARSAVLVVAREGWTFLLAGPLALWGRINHWLPFHFARLIAMRSIESAADPAMRTIVAGAALVIAAYAVQGLLVAKLVGWIGAVAYLISLPVAADLNFYLGGRVSRAVRRARAFRLFRRDPALRQQLRCEARELRDGLNALEAELTHSIDLAGGR
jgi:1-acyl-sn-glycerol-3-phosphate acyltransferase